VLLDLENDAFDAAISMATIPAVALRQTRNGEISMWKACAPATAAQSGLRAARLASLGLRGPTEPFVGANGFEMRVSGVLDRQSLQRTQADTLKILTSHIKKFPVQYHTQAGIEAALGARAAMVRDCSEDPLTEVLVTTSQVCVDLTADSPNKWIPETRETADHSMPYLVVTALRDGQVTSADFAPASFRDPSRVADMAKVRVEVDPVMTSSYPDELTVRVQTMQMSGATTVETVRHPLGHAARPMSDGDVEDKFHSLTSKLLAGSVIARTLEDVWRLESLDSLRSLLAPVVIQK
jgi:2-methylcitrate dehydratase